MESKVDDLKVIAEKLEVLNLQLAHKKTTRRNILHWLLISLCVIIIIFAVLFTCKSPYLGWDYGDPETAIVGVAFHGFEWLFVRLAPMILMGAIVGIFLTGKKA